MATSSTQAVPDTRDIPEHVAIIMDGNGRWATRRLLPRTAGHAKGVQAVRRVVEACGRAGVRYLTLFAFSSENWRRPAEEVSLLMRLFVQALEREIGKLEEQGVRLHVIGDLSAFEPRLQELIVAAQARTAHNDRLHLTVAANYGGRWDILQATRAMLADNNFPMGNCAELCAREKNISREAQDAFAVQSYTRSQASVNEGKFDSEIVPVSIPQRSGEPKIFSKDEEPFNVKFDKIPTLKSAFQKDGSVTAANASTMNDGASALVLMSAEKAQALGLKPLARIKGFADAEQAPEWFTTSPSIAVPKAVAKAGLKMEDISFFELNEAFSVVGLANCEIMNLKNEQVNVLGGAVALGHPLGSSGSRIIVTLINVLNQNNAQYGAAGICNGGGGASAIVIERL